MAKLRNYKIVSTDDAVLAKIQANVSDFVEPIQRSAIWQGVLYKNVSLLAANITLFAHKLNREPLGWIVVRKNAESDVWEDSSELNKKSFIGLKCSNDVTIDIWVF